MVFEKKEKPLIVKNSSGLLFWGKYSIFFKNWLRYLPKNRLFIVEGDRLKRDLVLQLQELEKFLGLPPFIDETHFIKNELGFYCAKSEGCVGGGKGIKKHPKMDPDVENTLRQYFKPYNEEFFSLIGRKFNWKETADPQ